MSGNNALFIDFGFDAADSSQGVLDEETFKRVLCRERKRVERSGSSLLLAVLDLTAFSDAAEREKVETILLEHLTGVIRETDACGWLKEGEALGIVFTLVAGHDVAQAMQTVELKVRGCLKRWLMPSAYQKFILIFQVFPDKRGLNEQDSGFNLLFYPEIAAQNPSEMVLDGLKRSMNIAGSLVALILLSPVILAIALLVKLTSEGPALFRQERLGQYGRPFMFLKFRTMYVNNDDSIHRNFIKTLIANGGSRSDPAAAGNAIYKIQDDPRVTSVGKFLRKTSLDELPQFINVLIGDMSLVGPRPAIAYEVDTYAVWHRYRVLARKPGITGLWQVKGRSVTTFDEMVRLDLRYIRNWSIWLDIKLLLATPKVVIYGKGAY